MADDAMDLQALLGKSSDADFLREMIGFAAQRLMELEVGDLTGAAYGEEPGAARPAQRLPRARLGDACRIWGCGSERPLLPRADVGH